MLVVTNPYTYTEDIKKDLIEDFFMELEEALFSEDGEDE